MVMLTRVYNVKEGSNCASVAKNEPFVIPVTRHTLAKSILCWLGCNKLNTNRGVFKVSEGTKVANGDKSNGDR